MLWGRGILACFDSAAAGTVAVQRQPLTQAGQEVDRLLLSPDGRLLYLLSGSQLSLWQLAAAGPLSLFMLPVEGALLVRDGDGHLSLWFDAARDDGPQLTPILTYAVTLDAGAGAPGWFRRTRRRGTVNLV